ncbi:MAG: head-tail adaptor protein [Pseudomonadota bacterium]
MIGPLRHKLERLTATRHPDGGGGASLTWDSEGELWARIDQLTPIRDLTGDRRSFLKRLAAEIRPDRFLQAGDRVRYDHTDFEVVSVETLDDRQRRMILICEEVIA